MNSIPDTADKRIMEKLSQVIDPELGVNIVDLGLVYLVSYDGEIAKVEMTLTTPGCPMHDMMVGGVERALKDLPEVKGTDVKVVWNPPWSPQKMSDKAKASLGYI
jgi:metal-sulfur cluster biosynthetic enzyme